jgi:HAMP domain-containing protein
MIHKKLKFKIIAGFMLLIAMLALAGTISITEFIRLSNSFNALIEDNYKSIEASKTMLEALEREDSGFLLLLLGQKEQGNFIIASADSSFLKAFKTAEGNITEENESQYIDTILQRYNLYKEKLMKPISDTTVQYHIDLYHNNIHKSFLNAKHAINKLMYLNQSSMHAEAAHLKDKSQRAIMPGIVAIAASLIFALLLNFFITRYFISPIIKLTNSIRNFKPGFQTLGFDVESEDEIKALEQEIIYLVERLGKF